MQEIRLPKQTWKLVLTDTAKTRLAPNFINLVQTAYARTPEGSFVNTVKDVVPSQWLALDWDSEPDIDATIFYRLNRAGEPWVGYKIQGIGHDGQRTSIDRVMQRLRQQLKVPGWWVEASDALEHVLYKDSTIRYVDNQDLARRIFPNTGLKMSDDRQRPGRYTRRAGAHTIKETIFGLPKVR